MIFYKGHQKKVKKYDDIARDVRNRFKKRSGADIENELQVFSSINFKDLSVQEIEKRLSPLINGHSRKPYKINFKKLYRVRKNDTHEFNLVENLWYPNWEQIEEKYHCFGRCNDIKESVFYCSTEAQTAIVESKPQLKDIITLVEFSAKQNMFSGIIQPISPSNLINVKNGYDDIFANHYKIPKEFHPNDLIIDSFLNDIFTKDVAKNENWQYKISVAISKILLTGNHDGIIYPSVSRKMQGVNYAMKTNIPDNHLEITNGEMYKIINVIEGKIYELEKIKILDRVLIPNENYKKGLISWRDINNNDKEIKFKVEY